MIIGIVEDEPLTAIRIQELAHELLPEAHFLPMLNSVRKTREQLQRSPLPDLLLMDIHLSDGSCFEIFEQMEVTVPIIFITSYSQYAIKAFETNSIDYLLKPIEKTHLQRALTKWQKWGHIQRDNQLHFLEQIQDQGHFPEFKKRFLVKTGNSFQYINESEVAFFYSEHSITSLYTSNGKSLPLELSLDKLEPTLNPSIFFRINRKTLVRIDSIRKVHVYFSSRLKVEPHAHLQSPSIDWVVSRERVASFKAWLNA